jgi:lipopolysaccharide transport protein LptA
MVATLTAVGGLYWVGRSTVPAEDEPVAPTTATGGDDLISQGFEYAVADGERPLLKVKGGRVLQQKGGAVDLEKVAITLYRPNGEAFELEGERATYDQSTNAARVEGQVRLAGPRGFELETSALELAPGGKRLATERGVRFRWGSDYEGRANALKADLASDSYVLTGEVRVTRRDPTAVPFELTARRVLFDRSSGALHAEGDAKVRQGQNLLTAGRLAAQISPETQKLESIRARFGVFGRFLEPTSGVDKLRFDGDQATLLFTDGEARTLELEGQGAAAAKVVSRAPTGVRVLTAPYIVAQFAASQIQSVEALEGARLEDRPAEDGEATRRASSRRAEISFADGVVKAATLQKNVVLTEAGRELRADNAFLDLVAERADFFGKPAIGTTERGELRAPKLSYSKATGLLLATDGVQAVLTRGASRGLADLGLSGEGPVQVAAREASLRDQQGQFSFLGAVRAWRGTNVLVADQLRGDDVGGPLTASGNVKTLWQPANGTTAGAAGAVGGGKPIEITASTLVYDAAQGVATYSEHVEARQAEQTLTCDEAKVRLDADKRAREVECAGAVRLSDGAANRRVEGQLATYDLVARSIVVRGQPVVLTDPVRGKAEGRRVIYELQSGKMRLLATDEDPAS